MLVILFLFDDCIWNIVCCNICWKFNVGCVFLFFLRLGIIGVVLLMNFDNLIFNVFILIL